MLSDATGDVGVANQYVHLTLTQQSYRAAREDIAFEFRVDDGLDRSWWDWIGLYQIGNACSIYRYVTYKYSRGYQRYQIVIDSGYVPAEASGEYVLLYVSSASSCVLGCSAPFRIVPTT